MTERAIYLPRGTLAASGFDNTYQDLGDAIGSPAILFKIINDSDTDIDISTDGSTAEDFVPAGSFVLYDMRANAGRKFDFAFSKGTQFTARGAAAGTGNVYLVVIAEQD